jgi:hypothetical protein
MNRRLYVYSIIATVIAVVAGLLTLLGYFVRVDALRNIQLGLLSAVSLLAAWAVLAGAFNLLIVHSRKFVSRSQGWIYSVMVGFGFAVVILANLISPLAGWGNGAANKANLWIFTYLLSSAGAALSGLIAFFLVFAAYRLLRQSRQTAPPLMVIVFIVAAVLALLALSPWPAFVPNPVVADTSLRDALRALTHIPGVAGARGLLLGIALGAVATGVRLLLGFDRPYGE